MRMTKCSVVSNHFYDADKYSSCPHCAKAAGSEPSKLALNPTYQKKQSEKKNTEAKNEENESKNKTQNKGIKDIFGKFKSEKKSEHTHSLWSEDEQEDDKNNSDVELDIIEETEHKKETPSTDSRLIKEKDDVNESTSGSMDFQEKSSEHEEQSVSQQINRVAMSGNIKDLKTVAYYGFEEDIEPVVGWLALLSSEDRGIAFELKCGRNTIGRSGSGNVVDISLEKDTSVSRGVQATIIYEPRKRKFIVKSNDSNTLVYLNDELLMEHEELHMYDRVSLGNSELLFMPLCSDKFSWDD